MHVILTDYSTYCVGAKFSLRMDDLYLDFRKFTAEKVDSPTDFPNIFKYFPITKARNKK